MKKLQFNLKVLFAASFLIAWVLTPFASADVETSEICFPVALRDGSASVCVTVFENTKAWVSGANILAVHGMTGTAANWKPLAEEMITTPVWGKTIKRVMAIDLPGHGKSPIPQSLAGGPFGKLIIDDNMSVILQTILALQEIDMAPRAIMGHSMGGLAIQGLQEALLNSDLSLAMLGVFRTVLFAPVPASGAVWNKGADADLTPFIKGEADDPVIGQYVYIPAYYARLGATFATLDGTLVPNLPSLEEMATHTGNEPLYAILQLAGYPGFPQRPYASEGAFNMLNGTILNIVSFSQDALVAQDDLDELYPYLTGDMLDIFYRPITADDACHGMLISNPKRVVKELLTLPPF